MKRNENIFAEGENAHYEEFLIFQQRFFKRPLLVGKCRDTYNGHFGESNPLLSLLLFLASKFKMKISEKHGCQTN